MVLSECRLVSQTFFQGHRDAWVFPGGASGKETAGNIRDKGLIPRLGRSPEGGHGNSLQCYCMENSWTEEPGGLLSIGLQRVGRN